MPPSLRDTSSTTLSGVDEPIIHGGKHRRHGSCRSSEGVDGNIIVAASECVDNPRVRSDILQSGGGGAEARGALGLGMPYAS